MTTFLQESIPHQRWYQSELFLGIILSALLFSIPVSSSLKSITFVATLILLSLTKVNVTSLSYLIKQPWVCAIFAFFLLVLVECLPSPASSAEQIFVVEKYSKLIWLPFLTLGFAHKKTRLWGLHAFLAAMVLICLISFGRALGFFSSNDAPGSIFRNYIMIGHMMAFASYLALHLGITNRQASHTVDFPRLDRGIHAFSKITGPRGQAAGSHVEIGEHTAGSRVGIVKHAAILRTRLFYFILFLMFSYEVLFISVGRTGYIIYFLLLALLMWQFLPKKYLLGGLLALVLMGFVAINFSTTMQQGIQSIQTNLQSFYRGDKNTSVGFRMQFQQFAFKLFKQNPLIGHGTGSLTYYFDEQRPVPGWDKPLHEPHNQYWLIAAEFGSLGLIVYFIFIITLTSACLKLRDMKYIAMALLIPFVVGCLTDSLLFYSGSGYFFLAMIALCLGEAPVNAL
jgi:O-antigen ligase